jgi:single-stranded-DNA-specific exonuclease
MRIRNPKRWLLRNADQDKARCLSKSLGLSLTAARLLVGRGIDEAQEASKLINPSIDQLHDPHLMFDMQKAVSRILCSIERNECILIYGDYDVDGTTGTVVLRRVLNLLGAHTDYFIPHRFTDGYGIHQSVLEKAYADGCRLVISVDCGIRAYDPLIWAREHGLDVIITDHHLPDTDKGLPPAYCVLNPNRPDCSYPYKNLAGVGVAFKLAHALLKTQNRERLIKGFLKMVAIGTVADVAPLTGENRTIVALGLEDLPNATNPGLRALMDVAGCGKKNLRAYDLGFRLGPRINAAGRMDAARAIVELFETTDSNNAISIASMLDMLNRKRQDVQREITERAILELGTSHDVPTSHVAVIAGDGWHRGVIGIAASKVAERIGRPCIVISLDGEIGHGSGRSIEAYHLLDGLNKCADLFERFGGHSHAAGLVIPRKNISELRRRLNEHASLCLSDDDFIPVLNVETELKPQEITLIKELNKLEPFGAGWPRPFFVTRGLRVVQSPSIIKDQHLKILLMDDDGHTFEAIWWGGVRELKQPLKSGHHIDLVYALEINTWNNKDNIQLVIEDIKSSG